MIAFMSRVLLGTFVCSTVTVFIGGTVILLFKNPKVIFIPFFTGACLVFTGAFLVIFYRIGDDIIKVWREK